MTPRATYRVQFTPAFGFDDAARLAPYLAKLGVSHLYASPYLKARPGSTHGYDIVDHNALNPELGDGAAFDRMVAALDANGLKQILDFVPNHMGVGGSDNPFWLDVLEWGPQSIYAGWFDIDWAPDRKYLQDKLLVPFLADQFGVELEGGKFALKFDQDAGTFAVWAYDTHRLPIAPACYGQILGKADVRLERLGDEFSDLVAWRPSQRERATQLKADLALIAQTDAEVREAIETAVARFNGQAGDHGSWDGLDRLIRLQFWRPAHFRVAADDINYRRFFNIAELAGLRMDSPAVFDHAHQLVFALMERGVLDGLRIDHIDGLLDPKGYLERLRATAPYSRVETPFYLVVEKILAEHEALRPDWPVQGTTGYEVTNLVLGLMVDQATEIDFTRIYADFSGGSETFTDILRASKKRIMDNEMASELASIAKAAGGIALQTSRTGDFTRNILRRALREIVACFPVYRTYVDFEGATTAEDRRVIEAAITEAKTHESAIDGSVYDFLRALLTGELAGPNSGFSRSAVLRCAMRLQQYSGPVMAKGLEDTAFYRYNRFIALNEVGGHPEHFGLSIVAFHVANRKRAQHWPDSMLGTSTHDTKRGEDARARLAALSECPDEWAAAVERWSMCLRDATAHRDPKAAPDRNDEYALYQTLMGTVPPALLESDAPEAEWAAYAERVKGAMQKAMREAKVHSTWASPDQAYENAMASLIETALTGDRSAAFHAAFLPFAAALARSGAENSLIQTALKLTMPGVPDIYQGTELWDLAMVDPDNRRPVDFEERARLLDNVQAALTKDRAGTMAMLMEHWPDARIKLALTATLLDLRNSQPDLFAQGSYEPLTVDGPEADAICAFARGHEDAMLVVVVALFPVRRKRRPISAETRVSWPAGVARWTEVLTGVHLRGEIDLPRLLQSMPVAVLVGLG